MKKLFLLLLCAAILLCACNANPETQTTSPSGNQSSLETADNAPDNTFEIPGDEKKTVYTVSETTEDGIKMEITLHGYRSESLGKDFYVKNNEYILADVKVINQSQAPLYQFLPTYCREMEIPHNHEIGFDLSCEEYALHSPDTEFVCTEMIDIWTLESGKTYEWTLKLAAGEVVWEDFDLPADGSAGHTGIKLYDGTIYTDGSCTFGGSFFFDYKKTDKNDQNNYTVSVPCSIDIVYVSAEPGT